MQDKAWLDKVDPVKSLIPNLSYGDGNWIEGSLGKFKFSAKVFSEPSTFGIKDGHISKLQICDASQERWGLGGSCFLNYDRGWDIRPKDAPEREFLNKLLEAFGDDVMEGDDYLYFELRGYETEADFDNRNFEDLGALDTLADAVSEAGYYTDNDYEVIKVICSDPEVDDVIIRPVATDNEKVA